MTEFVTDRAELELLSRVLETYGADRNRWPAAERLALSRVLSESAAARRLLRDAEVFDALIDRAPVVASARESALAARIVAMTAGMAQLAEAPQPTARHVASAPSDVGPGPVVRKPSLLRREPQNTARPQQHNGWRASAALARTVRIAPAAALLAAALLVGIFTGSATNLFGTDFAVPEGGVETADATDAIDYSDYVLDDVTYDALDEEFL